MTARLNTCLAAVGVVLAGATAALAQSPVLNPSTVEFDPSSDHSAVGQDGQPLVQRYELRMYHVGESVAVVTTDLGKPAPSLDGKIRINFAALTTPWPPADGTYEARVAAVGPTGDGPSDLSNQFSFAFQSTCTYTLSSTALQLAAAGDSGSVDVTTSAACAWTVSGAPSWLTPTTTGATGSGSVGFTAQSNTTGSPRSATFAVAGIGFTVTQPALSCTYTLSSNAAQLAGGGGSGSVQVTTAGGCAWTVSGAPAWLTLSGTGGTGGGVLNFSAGANATGASRSATLSVAGAPFTVTQPANSCTFALSPASLPVGSNGNSGSLTMTAPAGCGWSATSSASWVALITTAGTGSGTIGYTIAKNTTGVVREATISAGGQETTILQGVPNRPSKPKKPRLVTTSSQ